ncbi:MAG: HAD hydrolase-like protein [Syntrophorhabdaceae bacterium]|nr:HAD hydrolase-like protein [Syntrophorhabdaceae bacterium]
MKTDFLRYKARHIVFDFDGVIADTETTRFSLLSDILIDLGIDLKGSFSLSDIAGIPTDLFLKRHFSFLGEALIQKIVEKRRSLYLKNLPCYCRIFPGALETIKGLKDRGYCLHLVTANEKHVIKSLISHLELDRLFDTCFAREEVFYEAGKVKNYSLFLELVGVEAGVSAVIEDSATGISSAKKSGMFSIAFNVFNDPYLASLSDVSVRDYNELASLFGLNIKLTIDNQESCI